LDALLLQLLLSVEVWNMARDRYEHFAERYDLFFGSFDDHDPVIVEFFRALFERHNVHSVLDCACGTGRELHLFHSLGFEVYGSDISEAMLAQAERNLASRGEDVPLARVDFRELGRHYDRKFDAVVCLSSAFFEVPDEAELLKAFSSMHGVLREGGILVLTSGTSDKMWHEKPRFIPEVNRGDFTRLFVIDYLGSGARFNVLDIFPGGAHRDLLVWSITYDRVYLRDDLERVLEAADFSESKFFGSYQFQPYDKATSDILIAVAEKWDSRGLSERVAREMRSREL